MYFLGSCLDPMTLETHENDLLATYFAELKRHTDQTVDNEALEREWRHLYSFAWADFERFMRGWSPHHHKLTTHSEEKTETAIKTIIDELMGPMETACVTAGRLCIDEETILKALRQRDLEAVHRTSLRTWISKPSD